MAAGFPSGTNTYVPSYEASGHMIVSYSRNPKDFPINEYVTLTPVKKSTGYYLKITAEQAARVLHADLSDHIWHDGNDAPSDNAGAESFEFKPFLTERYEYGFKLGYKAQDQADWKILSSHSAIQAQQAMTARTVLALSKLTNTSNYDSSHTATATALAGGKWDAGAAATPYLKDSLLAAAQVVHKDTLGVVGPKDLVLVLNPVAARKIATSEELMDQFKQAPFTKDWVTQSENRNARWGLPEYIYGFKVVVEDVVKVTSAKGATKATSYAMSDTIALLVARPGGLVGTEGSASFSTGHIFTYEEMTVEQKDDPDSRRTRGRIVDDFGVEIVAPASGFVFTAIT